MEPQPVRLSRKSGDIGDGIVGRTVAPKTRGRGISLSR